MSQVALTAAQRKKITAATEVCAHIRKVLDGFRLYERGHVNLKAFVEGLHAKIVAFQQEFGDLELEVSSLSLLVDRKPVAAAEKREDSISHPLHLDGVHMLIIGQGVEVEDVSRLMDIWDHSFRDQAGAAQTFSTRFWEASFNAISIVSVDIFSEKEGEAEGESKNPADAIRAAIAEISNGRLSNLASMRSGRAKVMDFESGDLQILRLGALADLTGAELERQDAAQRTAAPTLSGQDAESLSKELVGARLSDVSRGSRAMALASLVANEQETGALTELMRTLLSALVKAGRFEEIAAVMQQTAAFARASPAQAQIRVERAGRFLRLLAAPELLSEIVPRLDVGDSAEAARKVLAYVVPSATGALIDLAPSVRTEAGKAKLREAIASKKPAPQLLAAKVHKSGPPEARELSAVAELLGPEHSAKVRQAGLTHSDPAVRKASVLALKREEVAGVLAELRPLAADEDKELRQTALRHLLVARDAGAIPFVNILLERLKIDAAERHSAVTALGTIGGPQAAALVRREFEARRDPELRAACANALANCGDEGARPLQQKFAKKWFVNKAVKQACAKALERLDSMKAARPAAKEKP